MANYIWPEITKDTPIEEVKKIHQRIWDYAIEHGHKPDTPYKCNCVACEYDEKHICLCRSCPIVWPENINGDNYCCDIDSYSGLHDLWIKATDKEKTELARQIRDLPWKFEMEEKKNV